MDRTAMMTPREERHRRRDRPGGPVEAPAFFLPLAQEGRMSTRLLGALLPLLLLPPLSAVAGAGACAPAAMTGGDARPVAQVDLASIREQVFAAERAFAKSMADRRLEDFARFVSEEGVFFSGPGGKALRGRAAVTAGWARHFNAPVAPFSWEPDEVEPLESGGLAHSSGPVRDPSGKVVARFNSIWRLEAPGVWRVIFDKGSPLPAPTAAAAAASTSLAPGR